MQKKKTPNIDQRNIPKQIRPSFRQCK